MTISCSFLQVYNEKIYDLLAISHGALPHLLQQSRAQVKGGENFLKELMIREDKQLGVYVQGLSAAPVTTAEECLQLLERGQSNRATSETRANVNSSRSHTIF